jgi:hypothetical protein
MLKKLIKAIVCLFLLVLFTAVCFADSIINPRLTSKTIDSPDEKQYTIITIAGPGKFVSAAVTKQGGTNDLTFVDLFIDGKAVVSTSFSGLKTIGLTATNPYGVALLQSTTTFKTLTIGFNSAFEFKKELKLKVLVKETGVSDITAEVVSGE